jgi:xanthine dehydrogenase accessory factor
MMDIILLRGGGDLASGVALRLYRAGFPIVIIELPQPLCVRRTVSFAEAVYAGQMIVEGVTARLVSGPDDVPASVKNGEIPVLVDSQAAILRNPLFIIRTLVDARLLKTPPPAGYIQSASLVIGLGPGFTAGMDCHAIIETRRGHTLGRVYWQGQTASDTGLPDGNPQRVLRAPCEGILVSDSHIGQHFELGKRIALAGEQPVRAPFAGILRGLLHPGLPVHPGMKIGDLDPRDDPALCQLVSDKALAVGGGVLEAILTRTKTNTCRADTGSH